MSDEKKYFEEINILRGIAVLLVAIGHSFPDIHTGITRIGPRFIFYFIYCFHMAIFFIISGFLDNKVRRDTFSAYFKKKFERLLIPYFSFSAISLLLKVFLNRYADNPFYFSDIWKIFLGDSPNWGLWFLWTLFVIEIINYLLNYYLKISEKTLLVFAFVAYLIQVFIGIPYLQLVLKYFVFYTLGAVIRTKYERITNEKRNNTGKIVTSLLILLVVTVARTNSILDDQLYLLTGICGSYCSWILSIYIVKKKNAVCKFLNRSGKYSYDIYLIGYYPQMIIRTILNRMFNAN